MPTRTWNKVFADLDYFEQRDPNRHPYEEMLTQIIERTIRDALGVTGNGTFGQRAACAWIHSENLEEFSFLDIVDELKISSTFVRRVRDLVPRFPKSLITHGRNGFLAPSLNGKSKKAVECTSHVPDIKIQAVVTHLRSKRRRS